MCGQKIKIITMMSSSLLKKKHLIVALRVLFFVLLLFVSVEGQSPRRCVRVQSLRKQVQYTPFPFKRKKKKIIFVFFFYLLPFVFTTVFFLLCLIHHFYTPRTHIHTHTQLLLLLHYRTSLLLFVSFLFRQLLAHVCFINESLSLSLLFG